MALCSQGTSFRRLPPSAQAPDFPAPAEKDPASAAPATLAQFSLLPSPKVETTPVLESWSRHNPARKLESPALAARARSRCRPPVETSLALAAQGGAQASVTAKAPVAV